MSDFNNNQNHDKEQDGSTHIRYCAICHRSEQDAGRLVDMPGGLSICPSCMQHMVDAASSVDYQQFMDQISKGMMPDVSDLMSLLDGIPGQSRDNGTAPVNPAPSEPQQSKSPDTGAKQLLPVKQKLRKRSRMKRSRPGSSLPGTRKKSTAESRRSAS